MPSGKILKNPAILVILYVIRSPIHIERITEMGRTTKPLSDTEIKNAKPKDRVYNLADGKGLYLNVKPSGYKVWIFNYQKPFTKKRVADTLGEYPALTLARARSKRNGYLTLLADSIDPIEHKLEQSRLNAEKNGHTLSVVAEKWIEVKKARSQAIMQATYSDH